MKNLLNNYLKFFVLISTLFSLSTAAAAQPNLPCTPPPAGQVAWYAGDGNAVDIQGSNNGNLQNGATFTNAVSGKASEAFSFDGVDDKTVFNPQPARTSATVEAWLNPSVLTGGYTDGTLGPITRRTAAGGVGGLRDWSIGLYGGKLGALAKSPGGINVLQSNIAVQTNAWYHVALTLDGATAKLYVNGILEASAATAPNFTLYESFQIGGAECCTGDNFAGLVDEVSLYDRALAPHEILAIYNSGANGKCKPCDKDTRGTVAFFKAENDAVDSHGLDNNGTLKNGATFGAGRNAGSTAFQFDGSDDYVEIPDSSNLRPQVFTLEGWVNFASNSGGIKVIAAKSSANGDSFNSFVLHYDPASQTLRSYSGNGLSYPQAQASFSPTIGTWYHVAQTYDGWSQKIYINGVLSGAYTNKIDIPYDSNPVTLGGEIYGNNFAYPFHGKIDDFSIYDTVLAPQEIANLAAGSRSRCETCGNAPSGQVAWYAADSTPEDLQGANDATLFNGTFYGDAKAGSTAFSFDGVNDYALIPDNPAELRSPNITVEGWMKFGAAGGARVFVSKTCNNNDGCNSFAIYYDGSQLRTYTSNSGSGVEIVAPFTPVGGEWYHIAFVFDDANNIQRLYLNGVERGTFVSNHSMLYTSDPIAIGVEYVNGVPIGGYFSGEIDEIGFYNRVLTPGEIAGIYGFGKGGKCKPVVATNELSLAVTNTAAYQNQNFTLTATVTNHGATTANGVELNAALPANLNFVSADAGCVYNAATRRVTCTIGTVGGANFTENREIGSDFSPAVSVSRSIVVQPTWLGATQTNFTVTATESDPIVANNFFAADVNVLAPTAASVSIAGRITMADGRGIRNAVVTLTESNGSTRTVLSGTFGYYRFDDIEAGQNVILRVSAKRFRFVPNTLVINLTESAENIIFRAQP